MAITFPAGAAGAEYTNPTTGVKYYWDTTDEVWKTHVWPTNTNYLQLSGGTLTGNLSLGTNDLTAQDVTASGAISANSLSTTAGLTVGNGLTVSDGNIVMAAGHGIDFSADADTTASGAASTSELLDDYEEGTWTPGWNSSGGNTPNDTGLVTNGTYLKIGRLVYLYFDVDFNDATAVAVDDRASFNGLPFDPTGVGTITGGGTAWQYSNFANGTNAHWNTGLFGGTSDTWYIYCTHEDGSVTYNNRIRGFVTYQTS